MSGQRWSYVLGYVPVILLTLFVGLPILWMIGSSLKPPTELFVRPPTIVPTEVTPQWYSDLFERSRADILLRNSLIVAIGTMVAATSIATMAAYSVTRFRYPGRKLFVFASLGTYIFPAVVLLVPLYVLLRGAGLVNTHIGLIIVHTIIELPFSLWILRSFFSAIPRELDEAAVVDGASYWIVFKNIMLPLAVPGLLATAMLAFILSWSEYLFASVMMTRADMKTIPVGMAEFVTGFDVRWGEIMALAVVATIPVVILFALVQKAFIKGLTAGAVKG